MTGHKNILNNLNDVLIFKYALIFLLYNIFNKQHRITSLINFSYVNELKLNLIYYNFTKIILFVTQKFYNLFNTDRHVKHLFSLFYSIFFFTLFFHLKLLRPSISPANQFSNVFVINFCFGILSFDFLYIVYNTFCAVQSLGNYKLTRIAKHSTVFLFRFGSVFVGLLE